MSLDERRTHFQEAGYLGKQAEREIAEIRAQSREWFELGEDLNRVLQATAVKAVEVNTGTSFEPKTVATRLLMRSCGSLQGTILVAERGMVTEGQMLARSLLENAFCMAALHDQPDEFMELLKADAEAARREQGRFLIAQGLIDASDPETQARLKDVVESIGKELRLLSPKKIASMGPLTKLYLSYQKLSNDAIHPSAASLHRLTATNSDRSGWNYRWGPGKNEEVAFTLSQAIQAAIPIGIGFTQITGDAEHNEMFGPLSERLRALPEPEGRVEVSSVSS